MYDLATLFIDFINTEGYQDTHQVKQAYQKVEQEAERLLGKNAPLSLLDLVCDHGSACEEQGFYNGFYTAARLLSGAFQGGETR